MDLVASQRRRGCATDDLASSPPAILPSFSLPDSSRCRATTEPSRDLTVGWKEFVDLPEWGIQGLKAKIDTGARSSAIHARTYCKVGEAQGADGRIRDVIEFVVQPSRRHSARCVLVRALVLRYARVTDSGGHRQIRPFVETVLRIGGCERRIHVTVTNREDMLFRMILGRTSLDGLCAVDVSRKYLLGRRRRRRRSERLAAIAPGGGTGDAIRTVRRRSPRLPLTVAPVATPDAALQQVASGASKVADAEPIRSH